MMTMSIIIYCYKENSHDFRSIGSKVYRVDRMVPRSTDILDPGVRVDVLLLVVKMLQIECENYETITSYSANTNTFIQLSGLKMVTKVKSDRTWFVKVQACSLTQPCMLYRPWFTVGYVNMHDVANKTRLLAQIKRLRYCCR